MQTTDCQLRFDEASAADTAPNAARIRMFTLIGKLAKATTPPWQSETEIILDEGGFQRAMRLVPAEESRELWDRYDQEMDRLYTMWRLQPA